VEFLPFLTLWALTLLCIRDTRVLPVPICKIPAVPPNHVEFFELAAQTFLTESGQVCLLEPPVLALEVGLGLTEFIVRAADASATERYGFFPLCILKEWY